VIPQPVAAFLARPTPGEWVDEAVGRLPELLQDHANCELKAASTALGFIYRYPMQTALVQKMSRLAREELRHFEQVRKTMHVLSLPFQRLSASRYAASLRDAVRAQEPLRLFPIRAQVALQRRKFKRIPERPTRTLLERPPAANAAAIKPFPIRAQWKRKPAISRSTSNWRCGNCPCLR
jgi:hypothetical protein